MSTFDIVVIVLILMFGVIGYLSGFMVQLVRIIALVVSYFLSAALSPYVADQLNYGFGQGHIRFDVVAFGIVWFFSYFITSAIGYAIVRRLKRLSPSLSDADRYTGMFVGMLKGTLLVLGITSVLLLFKPQYAPSWRGLSRQLDNSITVGLIKQIPLPDSVRDWEITNRR